MTFALLSFTFAVFGYLLILLAVVFMVWLLWQLKIGELSTLKSKPTQAQINRTG